MDLIATLPAFVLAVLLISASPGPAMALILRRAAVQGWRGAVPTVLGLELGLYAWALLAAAGFAALVAVSEVAWLVLKVAGAGVLLYLGVRAWRSALSPHVDVDEEVDAHAVRATRRWWARFGEGRPLFATTAGLALLQVALETSLSVALAAAVGRAGGCLRRPPVRRRVEAVSGTVMAGLGVRVALSSR